MNPFMVGKVAVQVFLVSGPTPDTTFTVDEDLAIRAAANNALALLGDHAAANVLRIPLQFSLSMSVLRVGTANAFPPLNNIGTGPEFELRESPWRDAALALLGHPGGPAGCLSLAAAGQGGATHSFVCWITKYNLAWQAYANPERASLAIDWRWLLDVSRRGCGLPAAHRILAHEIGHIFQAPDEGAMSSPIPGNPPIGCTVLTPNGQGYGALDFPNFNCTRTNPSSVKCLMRFSKDESSFLCSSTRVHWGWVDSNGDGVLDIFQ